jgi:hypothetical protein
MSGTAVNIAGRWLRVAIAASAAAVMLAGCTLTAAELEENRQAAQAVNRLDADSFGAVDVDCTTVPWLNASLAERFYRCWSMPLADDEVREVSIEIAQALAVESSGAFTGEVCGDVEGVAVQCAAFASIPEARDANVEIWVALDDDAVEALPPGTNAGDYFVTFRLVPYGPEFYEPTASPN